MERIVLDASMALSWALPDEAGLVAHKEVMDRAERDGIAVPATWSLELANSLLVAERQIEVLR